MKNKKGLTKQEQAPPAAPVQGHLEDHITELAASTKRSVEKHWKLILALLIVAAAGVATYQVIAVVAKNREDGYVARLDELTAPLVEPTLPFSLQPPPDESRADELPDLDGIRALIQDVEGARSEALVLKGSTAFLLREVDRIGKAILDLDSETDEEGAGDAAAEAADRAARRKKLAANKERVLATVGDIVARAEERFADDTDINTWATNVRRKIEVEASEDWLPGKRQYSLQLGAAAQKKDSDKNEEVGDVPGDTSGAGAGGDAK